MISPASYLFKLIILSFILPIVSVTFFFVGPTDLLADDYSRFFKKCSAQPTNPTPGQQVKLTVETVEWEMDAHVYVENGQRHDFEYKDTQEQKVRTINLGSYTQPGIYKVWVIGNPIAVAGSCRLNAAFSINTNPNLKLDAPHSPVTEKIKSLWLVIGGLERGKTYRVKLSNWKGNDLTHSALSGDARYDWLANADGQIVAANTCNDGQAERFDCDEIFGDQVYGLEIREKGGPVIGSLSFEVKANKSGPTSGQNPCGPEGKECPTALGNIPTNPKAFAAKVLQIGTGLAGGIAFILMVIGSIRVLTSSGDQQKLSAGRDMIVAAIAGLLFLIFSVLILRFIGVEILNIQFFR